MVMVFELLLSSSGMKKVRMAPNITAARTSGELPLQLPATIGFRSMNSVRDRTVHMSKTSPSVLARGFMPMNIVSERFIEEQVMWRWQGLEPRTC